MTRAYFFGNCRPASTDHDYTGHYVFAPLPGGYPGVRTVADENRATPWPLRELSDIAGDPTLADHRGRRSGEPLYWPSEAQPERIARLDHRGGWTALAFWDRSGDPRHGSCAVFATEGEHGAAEMVRRFSEAFPVIWARITAAGPVTMRPRNPPAPRELRL